MSEMMSALIVAGVSIIGQVVIGYWWKRGVEAKDEKITKLEERVDEMDTRRISGIERDIEHNGRARKAMYERMDKIEVSLAVAARDLNHAMQQLPKIEVVSREMAATAATIERVMEQVASIEARQFSELEKRSALAGRMEPHA